MIALSVAIALLGTYAFIGFERYMKSSRSIDPAEFEAVQKKAAELEGRIQALEVGRAFKRGA